MEFLGFPFFLLSWVGGVLDMGCSSHQRGMWAKRSDETGRASFFERRFASCTVVGL